MKNQLSETGNKENQMKGNAKISFKHFLNRNRI
jgi:hypothetical protein